MATHKDLEVWSRAMELAAYMYSITQCYPKEETYGLVSQIRRAAVSVVVNIAEGAARETNKEFLRFLYISRGSCSELDALLEISSRTSMADTNNLKRAQDQTRLLGKKLSSLIHHFKNTIQNQ